MRSAHGAAVPRISLDRRRGRQNSPGGSSAKKEEGIISIDQNTAVGEIRSVLKQMIQTWTSNDDGRSWL